MTDRTPASVLVVEPLAHLDYGHFPVRFAALADAFVAAGTPTQVLTARGWSMGGAATEGGVPVHRFGRVARVVDGLGQALARRDRAPRFVRSAGEWASVAALMGSIHARRRAIGARPAVVLLGLRVRPLVAAALAGRGHWTLHPFAAPMVSTRGGRLARLLLDRWAAQRAGRPGHSFRIAVQDAETQRQWAEHAPSLAPKVMAISGCTTRDRDPGARAELGIGPDERVALVFGGAHPEKDTETVWEAFSRVSSWRLVVAGLLAEPYVGQVDGPPGVMLLPGSADERRRAALYSAADVAVLSFVRGYRRDSGTLMDALSWGVPVLCSSESAAADLVDRYGLGAVFAAGDASSLADTLASVPTLDALLLARAREDLSDRTVARAHLATWVQEG